MRENKTWKNVVNDKKQHKINEEIRGDKVRLVGDNVQEGVYDINLAKRMAEDMDMDLVLVGANSEPVVCKIMNYQKFMYEQNKNKSKSKTLPIKEMRFTPNTGKSDLEFKTKQIEDFIKKGHKVKVYVNFKGREMAFQDRGKELLLSIAVELEEIAIPENLPKTEGKKMIMFIKPKK
jgi:translation initiation factor IF-3